MLPIAELLEVVPRNLPLSVEVAMPRGQSVAATAWAGIVLEETRRFLSAFEA
jgi:hypothetical protein